MKFNLFSPITALLLKAILGQNGVQETDFPIQGSLDHDFDDPKYVELWKEQIDLYVQSLENNEDADKPEGRSLLALPDWGIVDVLAPIFKKVTSCEAIKYGIRKAKTIAKLPGTQKLVMKGIKMACVKYGQPKDVCNGFVDKYGPSYIQVVKKMDLSSYGADLLVFGLLRKCPHPNLPETKISLPSPKQINIPKASNSTLRVLHLSDLHFDPDYQEGTETRCGKPVCCHKDSISDGKSVQNPAGKWGDYKCDIPKATLESMLDKIQKLHRENPIDMVIFGGDVPPHTQWKETWEHSKTVEAQSYNLIKKYLNAPNTKIFPVVGNHEGIPSNLFPFENMQEAKNFELYPFLADQWKEWIPEASYQQARKTGFYSVNFSDKLKVINLNNNLCYAYNVYLLLQPLNEDPNGMFKWFIKELQEAEAKGQKVFISSHVPPNGADCLQKFSQTYSKIVKSFAHIITAQFYGHTHWDEFEIFYSDSNKKTAKNAVSNSFIAPSMTTFTDINPGFRIYEVDANSFYVKDFIQYYADLNEAKTWKNGPEWKELYRPKTTYKVPSAKGDYITPSFWHEVTELLETEEGFNIYNKLKFKNSGLEPKIGAKERKEMICNLRASNSKEICRVVLEF